mgnify:FL=1
MLESCKFLLSLSNEEMKPWLLLLTTSLMSAETVSDPAKWSSEARAKTLEVFQREVYGTNPTLKFKSEWKLDRESEVMDGKVLRREYVLTLGGSLKARALAYFPVGKKDVPAFLGLNFRGNHTLEEDDWITKSNDQPRGKAALRWPVKMITDAGFALVTVHCADFDPDEHDHFKNGVHSLFPQERDGTSWGTVAGWAWGLSRVRDQLQTVSEINAEKVVVIGHSRLGKTALWAGAIDEKFAMAISNNSGCGGAALSKRKHGETVARINKVFPHWFAGNFRKYGNNEESLPVDQHQLIACIAPRPVYVASASLDDWADPEGEFLALKMAAPAFGETLGEMPEAGGSVGNQKVRYHIREGKHDIKAWDWERYLKAAKELL